MMKNLAVIPARGGSTRLKDKNIYLLGGKPLICYTIEAVLASECFDKVIVSTDSEAIAKIALNYPVELYKREAHFATEKITVLEAIVDMMSKIEVHDTLSYFLPTCPFTSPTDIRQALAMLEKEVDAVNSVVEYAVPIQLAMIKNNKSLIPVFDNLTQGMTNSKFIQKYYHPTGAFYMSWWDKLLKNKNFFKGEVRGHVMPRERIVDINDLHDIHLAEHLIKTRQLTF